jgi:hypothetical protein
MSFGFNGLEIPAGAGTSAAPPAGMAASDRAGGLSGEVRRGAYRDGLFARHRDGQRSCLRIGIQRGDQMHLNPIDGEAGPLEPGDELIVLCRAAIDMSLPLPTDPPIDPAPAIGRGAARAAEAAR